MGLRFKPDPTKGFECYCDADFSGLWNKAFAPVDPSTSKSQKGSIIFYAGCPISWASKLQSQVALSTTEVEYIAMSQALCDVIPIMGLLQEIREQNSKVRCTKPYMFCKSFNTTQVPANWQGSPSFTLGPSTSMFAIVIFVNMCERGLSKYSPLTPRTRLLMISPSLWHKWFSTSSSSHVQQVTSISYQSEGVLLYKYFGTYCSGTYVFRQIQSCLIMSVWTYCELFDFIVHVKFQAQNTIFRQN